MQVPLSTTKVAALEGGMFESLKGRLIFLGVRADFNAVIDLSDEAVDLFNAADRCEPGATFEAALTKLQEGWRLIAPAVCEGVCEQIENSKNNCDKVGLVSLVPTESKRAKGMTLELVTEVELLPRILERLEDTPRPEIEFLRCLVTRSEPGVLIREMFNDALSKFPESARTTLAAAILGIEDRSDDGVDQVQFTKQLAQVALAIDMPAMRLLTHVAGLERLVLTMGQALRSEEERLHSLSGEGAGHRQAIKEWERMLAAASMIARVHFPEMISHPVDRSAMRQAQESLRDLLKARDYGSFMERMVEMTERSVQAAANTSADRLCTFVEKLIAEGYEVTEHDVTMMQNNLPEGSDYSRSDLQTAWESWLRVRDA